MRFSDFLFSIMTLHDIDQQFSLCKSWEEKYRLLVKFSRELPQPTAECLAQMPEIHGCESRLWFQFQREPRGVWAYSDARLMQGLLVIVKAVIEETPEPRLSTLDLQSVFAKLQIASHLTDTRLNGLKQIEQIVREQAR